VPAPPSRSSRGFRDDIQGMRALAVLGILVYHLGLSPYGGGFVTLDVFFVLSGFLITTLLLREIERTGRVDLVGFYVRRARRILPAATVAIIGTVVASYLWINPLDARDTAVDAIWASLFGANVRFALDETDYFAEDDAVSPLQHFWSLSVEEQFYLVLPALLLLTVVLVRRRTVQARGRPVVPAVAAVLGVVTLASFAWSVHASQVSPQSAYFSTFTRSWEFGAGALLAVVAPTLAARWRSGHRNAAALAGLSLIGVALFVVSPTDPYPGWLALMPVVGTAAVLVAGTGTTEPSLVSRGLGIGPLRVVGDASYSLYLWHWPVIVVAQLHLGRPLRPIDVAVVLVVTALMTWGSYRFVETPFRRRTTRRLPQGLVLYPVAVSIAVGGSLGAVAAVDRTLQTTAPPVEADTFERGPGGERLSKDPAVALVQASVRAARRGDPVPGELRPPLRDAKDDKADLGRCENQEPPWQACRRGDPDGERTLVVLGDSHGRHWIPALEEVTQDAGWSAYYLVKPQCTAARVRGVLAGEDRPDLGCQDFNAWAERQVRRLSPDLVVVSTTGAARVWLDGEVVSDPELVDRAVRRGFTELFADLRPLARRVSLLVDVPSRTSRPPECLSARDATLASCLDEPTSRRAAASRISIAAARRARVDVVRTEPWLCADGQCPAVVGDMVVQRDTGHLTTVYARHLADALGRELRLGRR
jgi:peptidoglycan/LPS O-acetylase OafA/YrhL